MTIGVAAGLGQGQKRKTKPEQPPPEKPKQLRRYEVLTVLLDIAAAHNGSLPNVRGQWLLFMAEAAVRHFEPMKLTTFRGHSSQLIKEGLVSRKNGIMFIPGSRWRPPKNLRRLLN
jgi:hypothetical protein